MSAKLISPFLYLPSVKPNQPIIEFDWWLRVRKQRRRTYPARFRQFERAERMGIDAQPLSSGLKYYERRRHGQHSGCPVACKQAAAVPS